MTEERTQVYPGEGYFCGAVLVGRNGEPGTGTEAKFQPGELQPWFTAVVLSYIRPGHRGLSSRKATRMLTLVHSERLCLSVLFEAALQRGRVSKNLILHFHFLNIYLATLGLSPGLCGLVL